MGTLELTVHAEDDTITPELVTVLERYAHAVAQAMLSKGLYGDVFERVRRTQPMTIGAELLWSVLPPLTYATKGLVISAMLEPAYDNGGDAFDYAVNDTHAHVAVFDAMGHGLAASGAAVFSVAAYRNSRRAGDGLIESYDAINAAIAEQYAGRFVTAVFAQLELASGGLTWVSAGHPPPLLVRRARVVKRLDVPPATPLGLFEHDEVVIGHEQLERGDVVLIYTDGLTEARQRGGSFLTEEGLTDFLRQEATAELPTPEMLRRFRHTLLGRVGGELRDDASAVLIHWKGAAEERLLPESVR
jgi:serine phosphatase RsbU (regulator of sigma subunit)